MSVLLSALLPVSRVASRFELPGRMFKKKSMSVIGREFPGSVTYRNDSLPV